jgi:hypothetical protein
MRGQKVEWRPLCDDNILRVEDDKGTEKRAGCRFEQADFSSDLKDAEWIKPWRCESKAEYNVGHWVCDRFLDAMLVEDRKMASVDPGFFSPKHYVTFATDDCLWNDQGLLEIRKTFEAIAPQEHGWQQAPQLKGESPKVIINGYIAGSNMCPPTYKKVEGWDDWKFNSCRTFVTKFEVLTVRADLLREERFGPLWCADGFMVERLCRKHGMTPCFSCLLYTNALRPEQWGFPASHQR